MDEFRSLVSSLDATSIASSLGIPTAIVDSLGLGELTGILSNPPPGIDEIVALSQIFKYGESAIDGPVFDRIVIDTAPTGHTIRLLQLPKFVTSLTGNLMRVRSKISGALASFKNLFGSESSEKVSDIDDILGKIENLQENMSRMQKVLKDKSQTEFLVVTIPTSLAVAESRRLVSSLKAEDIFVSGILCNQVIINSSFFVFFIVNSIN